MPIVGHTPGGSPITFIDPTPSRHHGSPGNTRIKCGCGNQNTRHQLMGKGGYCPHCGTETTDVFVRARLDGPAAKAQKVRADNMQDAITFAVENDDALSGHGFEGGIAWLRAWNEGDPDARRLLETGLPPSLPTFR